MTDRSGSEISAMAVYSDLEFEFQFGPRAGLPISQLPHVVSDQSQQFLRTVLDVMGAEGGVWGGVNGYPRNSRSEVIFDDISLDMPHQFSELWGLPCNQQLVIEKSYFAKLAQFSMVVDRELPESVVGGLVKLLPRGGYSDCIECLELVVVNVESLKWAYIPLSDEIYDALLIAAPQYQLQVADIESRLAEQKLPCHHVVCRNDRCELV